MKQKRAKFLAAAVLIGVMAMGSTVSAYAVTPHLKLNLPTIPTITLPDSVLEDIANKVSEEFNGSGSDTAEEVTETTLGQAEVTQALYYHTTAFYSRTRLQVRWDTVEDADSYEVLVTAKDGTSKTFTTSNTSLFVYKGDDDFVENCLRSGTVQVRACSDDGAYGEWSEASTIKCNSLH